MNCRRDDIAANGGDLAALNELEKTMWLNLGTDAADLVLDVYSLATGGLGQGGILDESTEAVGAAAHHLVRYDSDMDRLLTGTVLVTADQIAKNPEVALKFANAIASWAGIPLPTHPDDPEVRLAAGGWRKAGAAVGLGFRASTEMAGSLSATIRQPRHQNGGTTMKEVVAYMFGWLVWLLVTLGGLAAIFVTPVLSYLMLTPLELLLADTRPAAFIVGFASIPLTALPMLATLAVTIVIGSWVRRVVAAQVTRNQPDRTVVIL